VGEEEYPHSGQPVKLYEDLLQSVSAADCETRGVAVGLHWTAVESLHVGMAHTYKTHDKVELRGSGVLAGKSALELAARLKSDEPLEASLGLAAVNSLVEPAGRTANAFEIILGKAPGKAVTVIGRFPFNRQVAETAGKAYLLEMEPQEGELPASAAERVVPESDVCVITATAIINHTIPRLLELAQNAFSIVLGPSTPMNDVLFDYGVDVIAGVKVVDRAALQNSVIQGVKAFKRLAGVQALVRTRG
jgi:uncharacterized protein (DUF4213/DUF364 family)